MTDPRIPVLVELMISDGDDFHFRKLETIAAEWLVALDAAIVAPMVYARVPMDTPRQFHRADEFTD